MNEKTEEILKDYIYKKNAAVFPVHYGKKIPFAKLKDSEGRSGFYIASKSINTLKEQEKQVRKCNWAMACGGKSGIWVLDVDVKNNNSGFLSLADILKGQELPQTFTVVTPSGGMHYYFKHQDGCKNLKNVGLTGGLDFQGNGSYVLIPPSFIEDENKTKKEYQIVNNCSIAETPQVLMDFFATTTAKKIEAKTELIRKVAACENYDRDQLYPIELSEQRRRANIIYDKYKMNTQSGQRNQNLFNFLCQFRDSYICRGVAEEYSSEFVRTCADPNFTLSEANSVLAQVYKMEARGNSWQQEEITNIKIVKDKEIDNSQFGIAESFVEKMEGKICHNTNYDFMLYDEKKGYWLTQCDSLVFTKVAEHLKELEENASLSKTIIKRSENNIKGILSIIKNLVKKETSDLTVPSFLLNCRSNILDLRTLKTYKHTHKVMFTGKTDFDYVPDLSTDRTHCISFIKELLGGAEVADVAYWERFSLFSYFMIVMGYMITGEKGEHLMVYISGPTRSGKSLFANIVSKNLGSFSSAFSLNSLSESTQDNQNFLLASVYNKRLIVSSETDRDTRLSAAKIKLLTSDEPILMSFKHKTPFSSVFSPKIFITSNFDIVVDGADRAVWTRFRQFFFPTSHAGKEQTNLIDIFYNKRDAFMSLICEGAQMYYLLKTNGKTLTIPPQMEEFFKTVRMENDTTEFFLQEEGMFPMQLREDLSEIEDWTKNIYEKYNTFCHSSNLKPYSSIKFNKILKLKGFKIIKDRLGYSKIVYYSTLK